MLCDSALVVVHIEPMYPAPMRDWQVRALFKSLPWHIPSSSRLQKKVVLPLNNQLKKKGLQVCQMTDRLCGFEIPFPALIFFRFLFYQVALPILVFLLYQIAPFFIKVYLSLHASIAVIITSFVLHASICVQMCAGWPYGA